jgi:RNA polymerase sigma-70 factor, ECF subfamily
MDPDLTMDMSTPPALSELLEATASGDRVAFAQLYRLTGGRMLGLAQLLLRRRELAEEITQEAFVRVWQRARDYSTDKGMPLSWMSAIVRNLCIDRLRRERGDVALDDAPGRDSWADPDPDPLEQTLRSADARRLAACLDGLDPVQRRAIRLAFFTGLTHDQLAAHLGQPLGTVKSNIRRGLLRLKTCLDL